MRWWTRIWRSADMTRSAAADARGADDLVTLANALAEVSDKDNAVISGMLVAGADGSVLADETREVRSDMVAAMSAIVLGTATQLVEQVRAGEPRGCLFEGSSGHVAVFPLKADTVLVMFSRDDATIGLFNTAARRVLSRLRATVPELALATLGAPREPPGSAISGARKKRGVRPAPTRSGFPAPVDLADIPRIDLSDPAKRQPGGDSPG
jgi:predicted regulator of Ras-like GTPase activity (Roadblock/LC7/MglB family)